MPGWEGMSGEGRYLLDAGWDEVKICDEEQMWAWSHRL